MDQEPHGEESDQAEIPVATHPESGNNAESIDPADLSSVRGIMLALITICLFSISVLFGPDQNILPADANLEIPVANIGVRLSGFLFFGPLVIIAFTLYLHIFYEAVTRHIRETHHFSNEYVFTMKNLAARITTAFVFYGMPCVVLFAFAFRMLPRPESTLLLAISAWFFAFMLTLYLQRRMQKRGILVFLASNIAVALILSSGFYGSGPAEHRGWMDSVRVWLHGLRPLDLVKADLTERDLRDLDLSYADMRDADLSGANLRSSTLDSARGARAQLQDADLRRASMVRADLEFASLAGADLRSADLRGARLGEADLKFTLVQKANLNPVGCPQHEYQRHDDPANLARSMCGVSAYLEGKQYTRTWLELADLTGADLENATLVGATLAEATLKEAEMQSANLMFADLNNAVLTDANLTFTWLSCASLDGADLTNAKLVGTNMAGVDLTRATLNRADLSNAGLSCFPCGTDDGSRNAVTGTSRCLSACLSCAKTWDKDAPTCERCESCKADSENCGAAESQRNCVQLDGAELNGANLWAADLRGAQFVGAELLKADLEMANLRDANLSKANLQGANLETANLYNANLIDSDFSGASLNAAELGGAKIEGANLVLANLINVKGLDCEKLRTARSWKAAIRPKSLRCTGSTGPMLDFTDVETWDLSDDLFETVFLSLAEGEDALRGALMNNMVLPFRDLRGFRFPEAKLINADLRESILAGADLSHADLTGAKLAGADFYDSVLDGAVFAKAKMARTTLTRADLTDARMEGAVLIDATLKHAKLIGTRFNGADLANADLTKANLDGAALDGATLTGADLRGATGLTCEQLQKALDWEKSYRDIGCGKEIPEP